MQYEEVRPLTRSELSQMLVSGHPNSMAQALLSAAFFDSDWRWVQGWALQLIEHPERSVCWVAILSLGHLARIHRELDLELVLPALLKRQTDPELAGITEDALEDIQIFIPRH